MSLKKKKKWRRKLTKKNFIVVYKLFRIKETRGLYYKHITIVNDASRIIIEWCHNLEHHSRVINYNLRGIIYTQLWCLKYRHCLWQSSIDNYNMFIVQAAVRLSVMMRMYTNFFYLWPRINWQYSDWENIGDHLLIKSCKENELIVRIWW